MAYSFFLLLSPISPHSSRYNYKLPCIDAVYRRACMIRTRGTTVRCVYFRPRAQASRACWPCLSQTSSGNATNSIQTCKLVMSSSCVHVAPNSRKESRNVPPSRLARGPGSGTHSPILILSSHAVACKAFADLPIADRSRCWSVERILGETRVPPRALNALTPYVPYTS